MHFRFEVMHPPPPPESIVSQAKHRGCCIATKYAFSLEQQNHNPCQRQHTHSPTFWRTLCCWLADALLSTLWFAALFHFMGWWRWFFLLRRGVGALRLWAARLLQTFTDAAEAAVLFVTNASRGRGRCCHVRLVTLSGGPAEVTDTPIPTPCGRRAMEV